MPYDEQSRLKSVQEMYEKLDDMIDNSNSIKSQNGGALVISTKLSGGKRNFDLNIS
jgi:hypothetical protein